MTQNSYHKKGLSTLALTQIALAVSGWTFNKVEISIQFLSPYQWRVRIATRLSRGISLPCEGIFLLVRAGNRLRRTLRYGRGATPLAPECPRDPCWNMSNHSPRLTRFLHSSLLAILIFYFYSKGSPPPGLLVFMGFGWVGLCPISVCMAEHHTYTCIHARWLDEPRPAAVKECAQAPKLMVGLSSLSFRLPPLIESPWYISNWDVVWLYSTLANMSTVQCMYISQPRSLQTLITTNLPTRAIHQPQYLTNPA